MTTDLTWADVQIVMDELAVRIDNHQKTQHVVAPARIYGIPRGGCHVASFLAARGYGIADDINDANVVVDDLVDSGRTADTALSFASSSEAVYFDALLRKPTSPKHRAPNAKEVADWVVFPWERGLDAVETSAEDAVVRLIERVGEDPNRSGLLRTPARVVKALGEMTEGYNIDPKSLCTVFTEPDADEMIVLQNISFVSLCEHHLLPFTGTAAVGYVPRDGLVIGVSKLARVVHTFARRLQIQERLTRQVAGFLMDYEDLNPLGAGAVVKAHHSCMRCRGVREHDARMVTSATYGIIRDDAGRAEFLRLAGC